MSTMLTEKCEKVLNDKTTQVNESLSDFRSNATMSENYSNLFQFKIVYMFATFKCCIHSQVILVGTHVGKLPKENRSDVIYRCFRDIKGAVADSSLNSIVDRTEQNFIDSHTNPATLWMA